MMSCIFDEQLIEGPRERSESAISMKNDYYPNLMLEVYFSIETNSLT